MTHEQVGQIDLHFTEAAWVNRNLTETKMGLSHYPIRLLSNSENNDNKPMPTPEQAKESTADILHESESSKRSKSPETLTLVDLFDRMERETFRRVIDSPLHAGRSTPPA